MKQTIHNPIYIQHLNTPVGTLTIGDLNGKICFCHWVLKKENDINYIENTTPVLTSAIKQLTEYFNKERTTFNLELDLTQGTEFQQKVWQELQNIQYGQTKSYQEIATALAKPKASQAVGQAIKLNPIVIIIPCHRVIGKNKTLTGFSGGLSNKQNLLTLEQ